MTTATINGRQYNIHLSESGESPMGTIYRITGSRGAEGALIVYTHPNYAGTVRVIGIAALERLHWSDIVKGLTGVVPGVAA